MSTFNGDGLKVRCIDCTHFSGKKCATKNVKTSAKKRRTCNLYKFKGSFENREPAVALYIPYVSPQTRKLQKKMEKLGVIADPNASNIDNLVVPASDFFGTTGDNVAGVGEDSLIWTPDNE